MATNSVTPPETSGDFSNLKEFTSGAKAATAAVSDGTELHLLPEEIRSVGRQRRLSSVTAQNVAVTRGFRGSDGKMIVPNTKGLGTRCDLKPWTTIRFSDATLVPAQVSPSFKRKLEHENDVINSYHGHHGLVPAEYDMLEPYTILDTESYLARALERKQSLMFREGFTFTGDNQTFVDYATKRANQIGYVLNTTFENILKDIVWNLLICSNVFLVKVRDEDMSGGARTERNRNKVPVAAYVLIPAHSILPYMDGEGRIEKWRRFFDSGRRYRDYQPDDLIHFKWNVKPGHIFGTPRLHTVRDDIFALRRLEENLELLMLHHLFPLMQVKVGTPEAPCDYNVDGTSEIDMYRSYIQNMPKEGVLITDERVEVDVKGVGKEGADYSKILEHYKQRIFTGLGVSGIDLGETDTANRTTADNVSQNLRDQIKSDLQWFCNQMSMFMLKEWFMEAPFALSVQNAAAGVKLEFHELDPDGQIKNETHHLNLFNSNAITHQEMRRRIKKQPLDDREHADTHFTRYQVALEKLKAGLALKSQTQAEEHNSAMQTMANETKVKTEVHKVAAIKKTKTTHKTASGSTRTKEVHEPTKTAHKAIQQILQPANQHGKNLDPHKARSSNEMIRLLYDELAPHAGETDWPEIASYVVDLTLDGYADELKDRVKAFVRSADDADTLYALVSAALLQDGSDDDFVAELPEPESQPEAQSDDAEWTPSSHLAS